MRRLRCLSWRYWVDNHGHRAVGKNGQELAGRQVSVVCAAEKKRCVIRCRMLPQMDGVRYKACTKEVEELNKGRVPAAERKLSVK